MDVNMGLTIGIILILAGLGLYFGTPIYCKWKDVEPLPFDIFGIFCGFMTLCGLGVVVILNELIKKGVI